MRTASNIRSATLWVGVLCTLVAHTRTAQALSEIQDLYDAPQMLFMGGAYTAEASGYAALFHNPAGLARGERRKPEVTLFALEAAPSTGLAGSAVGNRNFGIYNFLKDLPSQANQYNYFRGNAIPAFAYQGFAVALLAGYRFAGVSDGTNVNVDAGEDVGIVAGWGTNLMSNLLKFGISVKAIDRNELNGTYAASQFTSIDAMNSAMKEGWGFGVNLGLLLTLPEKYLPTIGFHADNVGGMNFQPSSMLNPQNSGVPVSVAGTYNFGFALHPRFGRDLQTVFTADIQHIERTDLELAKRLHFGLQVEWSEALYTWIGANQLLPTAGVGWRRPGGNLELGLYGVDVGPPGVQQADYRFLMRYTIGF